MLTDTEIVRARQLLRELCELIYRDPVLPEAGIPQWSLDLLRRNFDSLCALASDDREPSVTSRKRIASTIIGALRFLGDRGGIEDDSPLMRRMLELLRLCEGG